MAVSFVLANYLGANIPIQFLSSLSCGGVIGYILAYLIHWVWNKVSGVMG
jgi:hypothetical protein